MPCDQVILNRVNLSIANLDVLRRALEKMGATSVRVGEKLSHFYVNGMSYTLENGKLISRDRNVGAMADRIKQAYGKECVSTAAHRFGWIEKESDESSVTLIKRY